MAFVGFLLGHGPRGQAGATRTEGLLWPAETVRLIETPEATEAALEQIAPHVPGGSVLRVVHVVEVQDDEIRHGLAGAVSAVEAVIAQYPAVHVKQFVVALVDREWDDNERLALLELGPEIDAVLVVSRSNEAAVQLRPVEEECMASDLAYALLTSGLADKLEDERYWLAGTSAVYYRRRLILASLVAHHVRGFLRDNLLADLPASHTECEEGRAWVSGRHLGVAEHLSRLDRSAMGGSVIGEIKLDHDLYRRVPPELLVDSLRSFGMQSANRLIDAAREQIERNRVEHVGGELDALTAQTLTILRRRPQRVVSAKRFLECVGDGLDGPLKELQVALSTARDYDDENLREHQAIEQELTRTIRRLPYPAGMVARTLGLGALGVAGYHALTGLLSLDPNFAVLGLVAGVLLGTPLFVRYQRLKARISALRHRYLVLAEERIRGRVALAVVEAAVAEVQELRRSTGDSPGALGGRFDALRDMLTELTERYDTAVAGRVVRDIPVTRLSVLLPGPDEVSTDQLVREFPLRDAAELPALVMNSVLAGDAVQVPDIDTVEQALLEAITPRLTGQVWSDLAAVLRDSSSTKDMVKSLLAVPTGAMVRTEEMAIGDTDIRRMAVGGELLEDLLRGTAVNGRLATIDRDSLIQVAIRPVPASMRHRGGDDGEG